MPSYTCAVAGCSSSSRKQDVDVIGWSVFPSRKKHPTRRKLWETRCKRGAEWRATQYHAICSKHFVDWHQELSCQYADPELFAYNDWGQQLHKYQFEPGNSVRAEAAMPSSEDSDGCVGDNPAPVIPAIADMQEVQNYNLVDGGTSSVAAGNLFSPLCCNNLINLIL
ncbi:hypothetical protein E2C01_085440 [Portunus trituberculatus]|uniref:THAP-type domain-containing protein n=1 Tax=Portunus trituberculatus TaxID=210409 RepID=A0A5B7J2Q4_PORTR|nr:hypothetical protein [Portunus trituberculatus]